MATIGKNARGLKRIVYVDPRDGRRKSLWLGKVSQRLADSVKIKFEHVLNCVALGGSLDGDLLAWLDSLSDEFYGKLADAGLVKPRQTARLGEFLNDYRDSRTDIKPQTVVHWGHTIRNLLDFFGPDKALRDVTEQNAREFRNYLAEQGLAEATIRRRTGLARQFFTVARKRKLIPANPFKQDGLPTSVGGNASRRFFVTREMTEQILDAAPDTEWRLLIALARYGGLRTPSESLRLRWADIDWQRKRFTVTSPKTEHHEGHESRIVPLFPELAEVLDDAFAVAPEGAEFCITRYRLNNLNLRTHFRRIIKRAGLQPWPRLWQNLRSSRQSELCGEFPEHVVCAWLGNSKAVAREHYLQVRDSDFERAADSARHSAQRVRKTTQYGDKPSCTTMHAIPTGAPENADFPYDETLCAAMQTGGMGPAGFEPAARGL